MFAMLSLSALHLALAGSVIGPPNAKVVVARPGARLPDSSPKGHTVGPPRIGGARARLALSVAPGQGLEFTWGELSVEAVSLTHREGWTLLLPVDRTIALGEEELMLPVGDWATLTLLLDDTVLLGLDGEDRPVELAVPEIEVALDRPLRDGTLELGFEGWLAPEDLRAEGRTLVVGGPASATAADALESGSSHLPD